MLPYSMLISGLVICAIAAATIADLSLLLVESTAPKCKGFLSLRANPDGNDDAVVEQQGTRLIRSNDRFYSESSGTRVLQFVNDKLVCGPHISLAEPMLFDDQAILQSEKQLWACKSILDFGVTYVDLVIKRSDTQPSPDCHKVQIRLFTVLESVALEAFNVASGKSEGYFEVEKREPGDYYVKLTSEASLFHFSDFLGVRLKRGSVDMQLLMRTPFLVFAANPTPGSRKVTMTYDENDILNLFKPLWVCDDVMPYAVRESGRYVLILSTDMAGCVSLRVKVRRMSGNTVTRGPFIVPSGTMSS